MKAKAVVLDFDGVVLESVDIKTRADQTVPVQFSFCWSDSGQPEFPAHEVRINARKATSINA